LFGFPDFISFSQKWTTSSIEQEYSFVALPLILSQKTTLGHKKNNQFPTGTNLTAGGSWFSIPHVRMYPPSGYPSPGALSPHKKIQEYT
jgi:hypothetical protein